MAEMEDSVMADLIRALQGDRTAFEHDPKATYRTLPAALCDAAASALQAAERDNASLREALEPIKDAHDEALDRYPEAGSAYVAEEARSLLSWDDFSRAAAALAVPGEPDFSPLRASPCAPGGETGTWRDISTAPPGRMAGPRELVRVRDARNGQSDCYYRDGQWRLGETHHPLEGLYAPTQWFDRAASALSAVPGEQKLAFNPFGTGLSEPRLTAEQMRSAVPGEPDFSPLPPPKLAAEDLAQHQGHGGSFVPDLPTRKQFDALSRLWGYSDEETAETLGAIREAFTGAEPPEWVVVEGDGQTFTLQGAEGDEVVVHALAVPGALVGGDDQ